MSRIKITTSFSASFSLLTDYKNKNIVKVSRFYDECLYFYFAIALEVCINTDHLGVTSAHRTALQMASGYQNTNDPYLNYWGGRNGAGNLFIAIRDCNIFLENIHRQWDMEEEERIKWTAEVKFLKAYYHFFLLQLYGLVPVVRENLPVNATPDEVRVYREPVDDVVDYIVELLDEAAKDLPLTIEAPIMDAGRITKPIALALKAKALVLAASPLFNGNQDYTGFKDNRGRQLIPSGYDASKWQRAAVAVNDAIETCHQANHFLFRYSPVGVAMSDVTQLKYTVRGAVTEKVNPETVWPLTQGWIFTQEHIMIGYFIKKIVNRETVASGTTYQEQCYPFPVIRLADLYLLYAEALNETKASPDAEVYHWIDLVRERAGLKGVVESWKKSSVPNKPLKIIAPASTN